MKILLYTISDFKERSIECIDLLLSGIIFDISVDFIILSSSRIHHTNHKIVYTDQESNYIGSLKYSPSVPNNYDYYIYLDSDILYFDKISKLININKKYTLVYENTKIHKNPWWYFKYSDTDTTPLEQSQALNAGSFAFSQSEYKILNDIYTTYQNYATNNIGKNAQLEQSIFNYYIYKYLNFNTDHVHDITNITQLFASDYPLQNNKKLYHFCGFTNTMTSKYQKMKEKYDQFISQK
jgi:hypothetical protein